jgi:hypothetical protein
MNLDERVTRLDQKVDRKFQEVADQFAETAFCRPLRGLEWRGTPSWTPA